jgi:hypothetical protein
MYRGVNTREICTGTAIRQIPRSSAGKAGYPGGRRGAQSCDVGGYCTCKVMSQWNEIQQSPKQQRDEGATQY